MSRSELIFGLFPSGNQDFISFNLAIKIFGTKYTVVNSLISLELNINIKKRIFQIVSREYFVNFIQRVYIFLILLNYNPMKSKSLISKLENTKFDIKYY